MAIPAFLRPLFWDLDCTKLEAHRHRALIVARIAELGTDDAVRWLRRTYSDAEIESALAQHSRRLSVRTLALWRVWLKKGQDWPRAPRSRPPRSGTWSR